MKKNDEAWHRIGCSGTAAGRGNETTPSRHYPQDLCGHHHRITDAINQATRDNA